MTEKKYCETCAMWDNKHDKPMGQCRSSQVAEDEGQVDTTAMLLYEYSEGGTFSTGPKFGCVHHTEKT